MFAPLPLLHPSGRLVDRMGARGTLIVGGVILIAAAMTTMLASSSPIELLVATALLGLGVMLSLVAEQS